MIYSMNIQNTLMYFWKSEQSTREHVQLKQMLALDKNRKFVDNTMFAVLNFKSLPQQ